MKKSENGRGVFFGSKTTWRSSIENMHWTFPVQLRFYYLLNTKKVNIFEREFLFFFITSNVCFKNICLMGRYPISSQVLYLLFLLNNAISLLMLTWLVLGFFGNIYRVIRFNYDILYRNTAVKIRNSEISGF